MITILSVWTIVVMVLFLGIAVWAWSGRNRADFEAAARIPMEDDDDTFAEESDHG